MPPRSPASAFSSAVLRVVGVLVFVHQQVAEALAPGRARTRRRASRMRSGSRIRSSKSTALNAASRCWYSVVDGAPLPARAALRAAASASSGDSPSFLARPSRLRRPNSTSGLRALAAASSFTMARAVVGVQHREAATQAGALMLDLQELQAQRVESAHGQRSAASSPLTSLRDALAHFARGLVGEGDRGDLRRPAVPRCDQVARSSR